MGVAWWSEIAPLIFRHCQTCCSASELLFCLTQNLAQINYGVVTVNEKECCESQDCGDAAEIRIRSAAKQAGKNNSFTVQNFRVCINAFKCDKTANWQPRAAQENHGMFQITGRTESKTIHETTPLLRMMNISFVNRCSLLLHSVKIQLDSRSRLSQHSSTCQVSSSVTLTESFVVCQHKAFENDAGLSHHDISDDWLDACASDMTDCEQMKSYVLTYAKERWLQQGSQKFGCLRPCRRRECAVSRCTLLLKCRSNRYVSPGGSRSGTMAAWICNLLHLATIVLTKKPFIYTEDCTKNNMPIYKSRCELFPPLSNICRMRNIKKSLWSH